MINKPPPPIQFFDTEYICPLCGKHLESDIHQFSDGSTPYLRHKNKFYYCHISCYVLVYECIKATLAKFPDDVMINNL